LSTICILLPIGYFVKEQHIPSIIKIKLSFPRDEYLQLGEF